jgi:hypothetical protein
VLKILPNYRAIISDVIDYITCINLTYIGKKVLATQKLNARHCKENSKSFLFARMRSGVSLMFMWLLLSY